MAPFESLGTFSYSSSIVTMALCCIVFEIKRDIGQELIFSHPLAFDAPVRWVSVGILIPFSTEKLEWCGYPVVKKCEDLLSHFHRIVACDGQTDWQTDGQISCHGIVRAMHTHRAVKTDYTYVENQLPRFFRCLALMSPLFCASVMASCSMLAMCRRISGLLPPLCR